MDIITRKDKYYSAIANGTADVPQPITRQEQYLYAMATKSGVVPEPVTPNEPYLYAICKGTKDVPAPVTRVQKYLYAIATGDDKYGIPTPVTHEEYWLAKILGVDVGGGGADDTPPEWAAVFKAIADGTYKEKYSIGDTVPLDLGEEGLLDMQIVDFDADELADGSGYAPITWISKQLLKNPHRMNPERSGSAGNYAEGTGTIGGWTNSELRTYLKRTIEPMIENSVRRSIKAVQKSQNAYDINGSVFTQTTEDSVWIPSYAELFGENGLKNQPRYITAFPDDLSRKKERSGSSATPQWWTRSARDTSSLWLVSNNGASTMGMANRDDYCLPLCFCT